MNKNKGFSLVELIIVIAIMGVVLVGGIMGLGARSGQKIKTASKNVYNMLGSSQMVAMSKGHTFYGILYNDDHIEVVTLYRQDSSNLFKFTVIQKEELSSSVEVYYKNTDNDVYYIGDPAKSDGTKDYTWGMLIYFDRTTGGISETWHVVNDYNGEYLTINGANLAASQAAIQTSNCNHICITKKGGDIDITVVPLTGKFYIN